MGIPKDKIICLIWNKIEDTHPNCTASSTDYVRLRSRRMGEIQLQLASIHENSVQIHTSSFGESPHHETLNCRIQRTRN